MSEQTLTNEQRNDMVTALQSIEQSMDEAVKNALKNHGSTIPAPLIVAATLRAAAFGLAVVATSNGIATEEVRSLWAALTVRTGDDLLSAKRLQDMRDALAESDKELVNNAVDKAVAESLE